MDRRDWQLVVHGGAGVIERSALDPRREEAIRQALAAALDAGAEVLTRGGSALDAVEASVRLLEDDPHFNAGRGAALTSDGTVELDAAIMNGEGLAAGAVAGVTQTRNPVALARAVMERTPHVLLTGAAAESFARDMKLAQVDPSWFHTPMRGRQLVELRRSGPASLVVGMNYGTVGAVARAGQGHVAAATSTGGVTGKRPGRVGDTPVIGAGTYADDCAAAISATGSGEHFIRAVAAHEICARMRLLGEGAQEAAAHALAEVERLGGSGGIIFVSAAGEAGWVFNSRGMYRAKASAAGRVIAIFGDE
jgi:beta-aspartyl-peptidase (threonine type)